MKKTYSFALIGALIIVFAIYYAAEEPDSAEVIIDLVKMGFGFLGYVVYSLVSVVSKAI